MKDTAQHPDDFASEFEAAFARLQIRVETACAAESGWPRAGGGGGPRGAALRCRRARLGARTDQRRPRGQDGYARYDRMLAHFGERLLPGRALHPDGERLPEIVEKAMVGGIAMLIAQRLTAGREAELSALAPEAIQLVLTPYLGSEEARRVAAEAG